MLKSKPCVHRAIDRFCFFIEIGRTKDPISKSYHKAKCIARSFIWKNFDILNYNIFSGQLYEIAEDIFSLKLKATVMKESMEGSYYVAVLRLEFDNNDYVRFLHKFLQ